jgi:hypothetical protein
MDWNLKTAMNEDEEDRDSITGQALGECIYDPFKFVMTFFDWEGEDLKNFEPDKWQIKLLNHIGKRARHLAFNGFDPVPANRVAVSSGHGIGKSCVVSWIILWILCTRPNCQGVITASTASQLNTKTWAEVNKWKKLCLIGNMFEVTVSKGNMSMYQASFKQGWKINALTSKEENSESFAGLHAATSTPFYIFDEASAVPDKIWEVAEGGLTDGEPMFFVFGNPTRNTGGFYDCFNRQKHRWYTMIVDSRDVKITNKKQIQQWVDDYGEDSDFVRVRVRGLPPSSGDMQFISTKEIGEARRREITKCDINDLMIMGVDIARGNSDFTVFYIRKGLDCRSYSYEEIQTKNSSLVVDKIQELHRVHKFDGIAVDSTSLGGFMFDRLRDLNLPVYEVNFGGTSPNSDFYNMRSYMYGMLKNKMPYISLPNDTKGNEIERQLSATNYMYKDKHGKPCIVLEPKDMIKKNLGCSPDVADALALTFAIHIEKTDYTGGRFAGCNSYLSEEESRSWDEWG